MIWQREARKINILKNFKKNMLLRIIMIIRLHKLDNSLTIIIEIN